MSKLRQVKAIVDLFRVEQMCYKLNKKISSGRISNWIDQDFFMTVGHIGISETGEVFYDDMYVDEYKKFMADYYTYVLSEQGYRVEQERTLDNKIVLKVEGF